MIFSCPHCTQQIEVGEEYAGQAVSCPTCAGTITIPHPVATPPTARVRAATTSQKMTRGTGRPPRKSSGGKIVFRLVFLAVLASAAWFFRHDLVSLAGRLTASRAPAPTREAAPVVIETPPPVAPTPVPETPVVVVPPPQADPLAWLLQRKDRWPKEVTLLEAAEFPAVFNGKVVGSAKVPAGIAVKVHEITAENVAVVFNGGGKRVPIEATNVITLAKLEMQKQPTTTSPTGPNESANAQVQKAGAASVGENGEDADGEEMLELPDTAPSVAPVSVSSLTLPRGEPSKLITSFKPIVKETRSSKSGLLHPGTGLTKEMLDTMQKHVRAGDQPWHQAFEEFSRWGRSGLNPHLAYAGETVLPYGRPGNPVDKRMVADADTAFNQVIMWYITGNEQYRLNALKFIRAYYNFKELWQHWDEQIRWGTIAFKFCFVADFLRSTPGNTSASAWTANDDKEFTRLMKMGEKFFNRFWHFMNQHSFCVQGTLAYAIYMDDKALYEKGVERTTVNTEGDHGGRNGSIKYQIREVTKNAATGKPVPPNIQVVEAGRDIPHALDCIGGLSDCAQIIYSQGTKVDPETGTVSKASQAVDPFAFLDDRLLRGAEYIYKYSSGGTVRYVPTDTDTGGGYFTSINGGARGRLDPFIGILYNHYKYIKKYNMAGEKSPYLTRAYETQLPAGGSVDYFGAHTLLFTPDNATEAGELGKIPVVRIPLIPGDSTRSFANVFCPNPAVMKIATEGDHPYLSILQSTAQFAYPEQGFPGLGQVALRVRTNGRSRLTMGRVFLQRRVAEIELPDTGGKWKTVYFEMPDPAIGGLAIYRLSGQATRVDLDTLDFKPASPLKCTAITPAPAVVTREKSFHLVKGKSARFQLALSKPCSITLEGAPAGVTVTDQTLMFGPNVPPGTYPLRMILATADNEELCTEKITVTVHPDLNEFVLSVAGYSPAIKYREPQAAKARALIPGIIQAANQGGDAFASKMNEFCTLAKDLIPVAPQDLIPAFSLNEVLGKKINIFHGDSTKAENTADFVKPGKNGAPALTLDGYSYLNVGRSSAMQPENLTVMAWVKNSAEKLRGEQPIVWARNEIRAPGWHFTGYDNVPLLLSIGGSPTQNHYEVRVEGDRETFFPKDKWVHIAATYDNTSKEVRIYRNGELQKMNPGKLEPGIQIAKSDCPKTIGSNGVMYSSAFATMAISDVRIYDHALSENDIRAIMEPANAGQH